MNATPSQATPTKAFEFFKPGRFTAVNGQTYDFSAQAVRELVDGYRPELSDAPFVVGHPKLTSPRFGRAERLFVNDAGVACCEPGALVPEFAEMVNKGLYPRVSASIFMPTAKGNPTPGKHYLKDIGFLGAAAPAVKGLELVQFAGDDDGVASFAYEDRVQASLWRRLRDFLIGEFGLDKADKALPAWDVDALQEAATQLEAQDTQTAPGFAAPAISTLHTSTLETTMTDPQTQARLNDIQAREAALASREAALAAQEVAARHAEVASFAQALADNGQLVAGQPADMVEVLTQLEDLAAAGGGVASFAAEHESHGKTGSALLRAFLLGLPKQVSFDKLNTGSAAAGTGVASFAAPEGYSVDAEGLELMARAKAYQADHPGVSLIDAAAALEAQD